MLVMNLQLLVNHKKAVIKSVAFFRWILFYTCYKHIYVQNSKDGKFAAVHGVVKAKGSWVTEETPP